VKESASGGPQLPPALEKRIREALAALGLCISRAPASFVIASDSFTVDDAGARAQAGQGLDDQRETIGEVIAGTAVEPHPPVVLAGNDAEAVVLDLVQPLAAGRQLRGFCREARRDEPGREGTLQHAQTTRAKGKATVGSLV
jgi:hypothetical protein